jgi:hypothetical protein
MFGVLERTTVGQFFEMAQQSMEDGTDCILNETLPLLQSDGSILEASRVGGAKCDHCNRTKAELGVDYIDECARCRLVFYCSKKCQIAAWKSGHCRCCRKRGEFCIGDQVIWLSHITKSLCSGMLVKQVEGIDAWEATGIMASHQFVINTMDLRRTRSTLWHCKGAIDSANKMDPKMKVSMETKCDEELHKMKHEFDAVGRLASFAFALGLRRKAQV